MTHLKYIGILLLVLGVSGFTWLHEHDKTVKYRALSEQQSNALKHDKEVTDGLLKAVASLDSAYAKARRNYDEGRARTDDSVKVLQSKIDRLAHDVERDLPDSTKAKVVALVGACKEQSDMIYSALLVCDSLRHQAERMVQARDTIIWRVQHQRDGYKKLWETSKHGGKSNLALWIERVGVAAGFFSLGRFVK